MIYYYEASMVLSDSNIIEKLKKAFMLAIENGGLYLNQSQESKEDYIVKKYNVSSILNFDKKISDKIKTLSILETSPDNYEKYTKEEKRKHNEKIFSMNEKIKSEEVFTGGNILDLAHQLYYESRLIDSKFELHYKIIHNLWCYIGNINYYPTDEAIINDFFRMGIDLYLMTGTKCSDITDNLDKTISAVQYFKLKYEEDYVIKNSDITLTDIAQNKIHKELEDNISYIGGRTVLKLLFENEIEKKYNKQLDRYLITKNKQLSLKPQETIIPYNYIIKLCMKHLGKNIATALTLDIATRYTKLIKDSKAFMDLLAIYNSNPITETQVDILGLIDFITENTIFENLCLPAQYNKEFIEEILCNIYQPEYVSCKKCPEIYKYQSFLKLIFAIISERPCAILNAKKLSSKIRSNRATVQNLLEYFSIDVNDSNANFDNIFSSTTSLHKPLVKLNSEDFFFLSTQFSGYAFCNAIQDELQSREFSRGLGNRLECFVKDILKKKHYAYKYGYYAPKNQEEKGECDLILEDEKRILFVELKNCGLPYEFENCDIITILNCLGGGMLKAQKQILHHRLHLKKNNQKMKLYKNENDLTPFASIDNTDNKRIYSISICASEYAFFTSGVIASRLTEGLPNLTFNAIDKSRDKELEQLNKLSKQFGELIEKYAQLQADLTAHDLFFHSTFKTLQQFYTALRLSSNISDFISYLTFDTSIIFPFFDFYANLLSKIKLDNA